MSVAGLKVVLDFIEAMSGLQVNARRKLDERLADSFEGLTMTK